MVVWGLGFWGLGLVFGLLGLELSADGVQGLWSGYLGLGLSI